MNAVVNKLFENNLFVRLFHKHRKWAKSILLPTCVPINLRFLSLFARHDVSRSKIRHQGAQEDYISRLQTPLVYFVFDQG